MANSIASSQGLAGQERENAVRQLCRDLLNEERQERALLQQHPGFHDLPPVQQEIYREELQLRLAERDTRREVPPTPRRSLEAPLVQPVYDFAATPRLSSSGGCTSILRREGTYRGTPASVQANSRGVTFRRDDAESEYDTSQLVTRADVERVVAEMVPDLASELSRHMLRRGSALGENREYGPLFGDDARVQRGRVDRVCSPPPQRGERRQPGAVRRLREEVVDVDAAPAAPAPAPGAAPAREQDHPPAQGQLPETPPPSLARRCEDRILRWLIAMDSNELANRWVGKMVPTKRGTSEKKRWKKHIEEAQTPAAKRQVCVEMAAQLFRQVEANLGEGENIPDGAWPRTVDRLLEVLAMEPQEWREQQQQGNDERDGRVGRRGQRQGGESPPHDAQSGEEE